MSIAVNRSVIIGAGGHGRVVADILRACGTPSLGFIDRDISAADVIGTDADIPALIESHGLTHFIIGVGSIRGGVGLRAKLFDTMSALGLLPLTTVHPRAIVAYGVILGSGTAVMAGATLNPGVRTGENVIINTGAVIDHDGHIGAHSHIAPGCTLSGDVTIGTHCLLGTGTVARHGARVGNNATVGAGSLLLGDYAAGGTYVGSPARALSA